MSKSRNTLDKLTDNFTSGQLVIGIVVTLFLVLLSFMLGVIVAKVDPTLNRTGEETRQQTAANQPPAAAATESARPKPPAQGASNAGNSAAKPQAEPKKVVLPPLSGKTEPRAPDTKPAAGAKPPADKKAEDAGAPSPAANKPPEEAPKPVVLPPAKNATNSNPPPVPSTTVAASENKPKETEPPKPAAPPEKKTPPVLDEIPLTPETAIAPLPTEPAPVTQTPPAAVPAKGKFGIQVGALFGADRAARAVAAQRELKSKYGIDVSIITPKTGQVCKLAITGYPDRASANAACAELRKKPGFEDAWVIPLE